MKRLTILLLALPFCALAEQFVLNRRNNTTVEISSRGEMLNVVCRFPAHTKFDKAINACLDDQKSQWAFVEGLFRYFKAGTNETMEVSGKHILAVKKDGDYLSYTFSVPKSGCRIVPRPVATNTVNRTTVSAPRLLSSMTNKVAVVKPLPMLAMANPVAAIKPVPAVGLTNQTVTLNHFTNTTEQTTNGGK